MGYIRDFRYSKAFTILIIVYLFFLMTEKSEYDDLLQKDLSFRRLIAAININQVINSKSIWTIIKSPRVQITNKLFIMSTELKAQVGFSDRFLCGVRPSVHL